MPWLTGLCVGALPRLNLLKAWRSLGIARRLIEIEAVGGWLKCRRGSWIWCFGGLWLRLHWLLCLIRILFEALRIVEISVVALSAVEGGRCLLRVTAFAVRPRSLRVGVSIAWIIVIAGLLMGRQIVASVRLLLLLGLLVAVRSVFVIVIVMQHILLMTASWLVQIINGVRRSMVGANGGPRRRHWCTEWQRVVNQGHRAINLLTRLWLRAVYHSRFELLLLFFLLFARRFNLFTIKPKRRFHDIFYWLFWNPYYYLWRERDEMRDAFIDPIAKPIQRLTYHEVFKYLSEATSFCWYFSFTNCLNFPWDSDSSLFCFLRFFFSSLFRFIFISIHHTSPGNFSSSDWSADSLCLFNHRVVFGERN